MPQRPNATPLCTPGVFLSPRRLIYLSYALLSLCIAVPVLGQTGTVSSFQKISDTEGGFTGTVDDSDNFGQSVTSVGDLDGDGVTDLAVGAYYDDDGGTNRGAMWILFLNANGTTKSYQKISDTAGSFTGTLSDDDRFGSSVASLGDLDGDGVADIAVGARLDDDGGSDRGAVWILFLNTNGTVKSYQKISDTAGTFTGTLDDNDQFGGSVASVGDLDGDGVTDLAVGAYLDDDGGTDRGAVWVLFLTTSGTVKSYQKISDTAGTFTGTLDDADHFGNAVVSVGDLDGDGVIDLAVGAKGDSDGGTYRGAVWILFLNSSGNTKSYRKISDTAGTFTGTLDDNDYFGSSVASVDDLDGDGVADIAVGARLDDDGGTSRGAMWILFLNSNGTTKSYQKISDTAGTFTGTLNNSDRFGKSVASMGDLDGDGITDIAVGATGDDDGGSSRGAMWILFLNQAHFVEVGSLTGVDDANNANGVTWADYDGDGDLDLFLGSTGGVANKLYRNNGDLTFTDRAAAAGVQETTDNSKGTVWGDYDNDGDLDLFINNSSSANALFRNDGSDTFTDVAAAA
ncbi:MAG: integrin alpha, partial [Candidatus Latescibacteria bacterium]|nr:integrin alpha [Candidatus Latescibacterota bacterium]